MTIYTAKGPHIVNYAPQPDGDVTLMLSKKVIEQQATIQELLTELRDMGARYGLTIAARAAIKKAEGEQK